MNPYFVVEVLVTVITRLIGFQQFFLDLSFSASLIQLQPGKYKAVGVEPFVGVSSRMVPYRFSRSIENFLRFHIITF